MFALQLWSFKLFNFIIIIIIYFLAYMYICN